MRADVGKPGLDLSDAMRISRGLGFGQERATLAVGFEHDLDQAFGTVRRFLGEAADAGPRRQRDLAMLDRDVARNGAEQRGLSHPVAPDEPNPRAVRNAR